MLVRFISPILKPLRRRLLRASETEYRRLEQMMGFAGQYATHRAVQMKLLRKQGMRRHHRVLEIGCGPLTLGIPLIAYLASGGYTGIDVRPSVVDEALALVKTRGLINKRPQIILSSKFGEQELGDTKFDVVVAFSVLYHLTDDLVTRLYRQVALRLKGNATFFANVNTEHSASHWLEFPFVQRPLDFYGQLAKTCGLEMTVLGRGHELGIPPEDISGRNLYLRFSKLQHKELER